MQMRPTGYNLMRRSLVVVLLVAAMSQLSRGEEMQVELDPKSAFKRLFTWEESVDAEEAGQLISSLLNLAKQGKWPDKLSDPPVSLQDLLDFQVVNEEKCKDKVGMMADQVDQIRKDHPGLIQYAQRYLGEQFKLCGLDTKYREDFNNFKVKRPAKSKLMSMFKDRASKFGKISKNWKGNKPVSSIQLNQAVEDMYEERKGDSYQSRGDAAIQTYHDVYNIRDGAEEYMKEVHPSMQLAKYYPDAHNDKELEEGLRYDNLYGEVTRTNYDSLNDIMGDAFYDPGNRGWNTYREFTRDW